MLFIFLASPERVVSRRQQLLHVWDRNVSVHVRAVDLHVRRLRSIPEHYGYNNYRQTVRGSGYRFSANG